MNAWSHLPNAHHIDWVLESVKTHSELWRAAHHTTNDTGWTDIWIASGRAAVCAARGRRITVNKAEQELLKAAEQVRATDAILALFAYDDCDQYLEMTADELKVWARLSESPAAVLLVPMVVVREQLLDLTNNRDHAILCT